MAPHGYHFCACIGPRRWPAKSPPVYGAQRIRLRLSHAHLLQFVHRSVRLHAGGLGRFRVGQPHHPRKAALLPQKECGATIQVVSLAPALCWIRMENEGNSAVCRQRAVYTHVIQSSRYLPARRRKASGVVRPPLRLRGQLNRWAESSACGWTKAYYFNE